MNPGGKKKIRLLVQKPNLFFSHPISYLFFFIKRLIKYKVTSVQFSSVQLLSRVRLFVTPWIAACQASLSITSSWSSPKLLSIKSVMPSSHLILCHPQSNLDSNEREIWCGQNGTLSPKTDTAILEEFPYNMLLQ